MRVTFTVTVPTADAVPLVALAPNVNVPASVGVPESTPVDDRAMPAGTVPEPTDQT